jgi:excisionase family DNA binding protein
MRTEVTVAEAAELLQVDPSRVRALAAAGRLLSRRVGPLWLVDLEDVERRSALVSAGAKSRAMSPRTAWAAAALMDGLPAEWLASSERARLAARLRAAAGWQMYVRWLAGRCSQVQRFRVAADDVAALLPARGVVATGGSAAGAYGQGLSMAGQAEVYVASGVLARLVEDLFLVPSPEQGNLLVRVVDADWHVTSAREFGGRVVAPRLMVAVDLLARSDARSAAAGRDLLARVREEFGQRRGAAEEWA